MSASSRSVSNSPFEQLSAKFLALMPRIERHARIYFRRVPCSGTREDAVQECLALAWKWLLRLARRGKDISDFPMAFILLVARAVRAGASSVTQKARVTVFWNGEKGDRRCRGR
jgi:hypothetical protein